VQNAYKISIRKPEEKDNWETGINERMIFRWVLMK
jgi:hypothetical protein